MLLPPRAGCAAPTCSPSKWEADTGRSWAQSLRERETGHGSSVLHLTCFHSLSLYYTSFPWFGAKSRQPLRQAHYGGAVCADAPNPNHDVPAHVRSSGLRLDPLCLRSAPLSFPHSLGFARSPNSFACQPCPPGQMPGSGSSDSACPRLRSS